LPSLGEGEVGTSVEVTANTIRAGLVTIKLEGIEKEDISRYSILNSKVFSSPLDLFGCKKIREARIFFYSKLNSKRILFPSIPFNLLAPKQASNPFQFPYH
jgi:hypothetical protein